MGRHYHEPLAAWACVNAILEFANEPDVLFAEYHGAVGDSKLIDPVDAARRIIAGRHEGEAR